MTFEEYKEIWLEDPKHLNDTDNEIMDWYNKGIMVFWSSYLRTKTLETVCSPKFSREYSAAELRENIYIYNVILKFKKEQEKLKKLNEDF